MNNFDALVFGNKLKDLRKQLGITQHELADHLGIHANTIASYESGKRVPPVNIVSAIAAFYGVTVDYLLFPDAKFAITTQGLSDKQQEIIRELADEFCSQKLNTSNKLTQRQLQIMSDLTAEFAAESEE